MMAVSLVVASGVALAVTKIGTNGPDTLRGTNKADNLIGKRGNDVLYALAGNDNLLGGGGKDFLLTGERRALGGDKNSVGGPGNDGVFGGLGSDTLLGGSGNDFVFGDKGSDTLVAGGDGRDIVDGWTGSDRMLGGGGGDLIVDGFIDEAARGDVLLGGDGNDIIIADHVPAVKDTVWCGGGFDRVLADRKDVVAADCERVRVVRGSVEEVFEQEEAFFESLPPALIGIFETFFEEQLAPFPEGGSRTATSPATQGEPASHLRAGGHRLG